MLLCVLSVLSRKLTAKVKISLRSIVHVSTLTAFPFEGLLKKLPNGSWNHRTKTNTKVAKLIA